MLIAVVCWLGFLKSLFSGALPSLMAKVFPVATRVSGMSLAYNIAVPIFGGFAPFFAQSLVDLDALPQIKTGGINPPVFLSDITA